MKTDPCALIQQLAPLCKQHGIRRLRVGDIELEFIAAEVDEARVKQFQDLLNKGMPTDDEVLFHSAPGFVPRNPDEGRE